ncbi:Gfo/Idh/MocA family oxidoreductase [Mesorhizobium sp. YR577]|uniref:Gfo/Idh/MocA family protein n=1 Tax=Mesorhizobium sp. YR577 TaxID=1884373 RepID=UPI0008E7DC75|nr:Gfo/Idh/MocA family oxidoreductase [Mesorhizobium sp. YR577]SFT47811.1 Predicted dehydrogenase [Mesorhizobium sp. YR577]
MRHNNLGIAIVGSGRMGLLRAGMAAAHPAVTYVAVSDIDADRAELVGRQVSADRISGSNYDVISDDRVTAVIVSTSEPDHAEATIQALDLGKPVLVEKPIALTLKDADAMITASKRSGASLHVAYSLRFNRSYIVGKQETLDGKFGRIISGVGRIYNTKSHGLQILKRSSEATFVKDSLTYLVDLFNWYMDDAHPVEVIARANGMAYRDLGYDTDDATWAIITYSNGSLVNIGINYALPANYPTHGRLMRMEIIGDKGTILFDHDHLQNIVHSEEGMTHGYVGHKMEHGLLTSNASGNKALGSFWGPLGDETRSWLDYLSTGTPCPHSTAEQARTTLELTAAIEIAAREKRPVTLPLGIGTPGI